MNFCRKFNERTDTGTKSARPRPTATRTHEQDVSDGQLRSCSAGVGLSNGQKELKEVCAERQWWRKEREKQKRLTIPRRPIARSLFGVQCSVLLAGQERREETRLLRVLVVLAVRRSRFRRWRRGRFRRRFVLVRRRCSCCWRR